MVLVVWYYLFVNGSNENHIILFAISGCDLPTTCDVYGNLEIMVSCVAVLALAVLHRRVGGEQR